MGEPAFVAAAKAEALAFIRNHPGEFVRLVSVRVAHFWDGDSLRFESATDPFRPWMVLLTSVLAFAGLVLAKMRGRQWGLFGWLLLLFPIPYYLTYTNPRYRHPIEPLMVVLTGYLFSAAWESWHLRRSL